MLKDPDPDPKEMFSDPQHFLTVHLLSNSFFSYLFI
jgi:hypothetical protein